MSLLMEALVIDCADPVGLARFWAEALGYEFRPGDNSDEAVAKPKDGTGTPLLFGRAPEGKTIKNRLHLDLRPADQAAEVARLVGLGAKKVDIGQGNPSWAVLADPEGNEFCILRALTAEEKSNA